MQAYIPYMENIFTPFKAILCIKHDKKKRTY
jgi:hypothetical protein